MNLTDTIKTLWYPAWDSGDPERFERVTRDLFYPHTVFLRSASAPFTMAQLLPSWLEEIQTWRPQQHVMLNAIDAGEWAAWEYHWWARYAGPKTLADGGEIPEGRRYFHHHVGAVVRWDGERVTEVQGYASSSRSHEAEMGLE